MKTLTEIKNELSRHYGSENLYHGLIKNCRYTEGMRDYYTLAECFWLHDIFQTEFHMALVNKDPDTYYLQVKVDKNKKVNIKLVDWEDNVIHKRHVEWTTHPEGKMEFHMGWDGAKSIICLPSED